MNTDSDYPLIDRYLDGVATESESTALAEAIEADPEALAALCEAADIEASLRRHFATPEQLRTMTPRIAPLWHWRRAGKWIAASAAAAALVVTAAILFWPAKPGGTGTHTPGIASGMTVRRLTGNARGAAAPAHGPGSHEIAGPMEEVEFPVHAQWLTEMTNARPANAFSNEENEKRSWPFAARFEIPVLGAADQMVQLSTIPAHARTRSDDYLVWYLRACGVTFPPGASAHWLQDQDGFVAVNTSSNIERITRIQQDPARMGAKNIIVYSKLWCVPEGVVVPTLLQQERILTATEVESLPESISDAQGREIRTDPGTGIRTRRGTGLMVPSECQCRFLLRDDTEEWTRVHAHLQLNQWRVGDHVVISGLAGPRPDGEQPSSAPEVKNAEMEFELTLAGGEAAVLHLGRKPDGTDWILVLRVSIGNVQYPLGAEPTFTLGNKPNLMKFDQTILTAKAGTPVRLLHKNDACVLLHNFVLVKPGTAAAVGALADQMLRVPDALAKLYIPVSPDILVTGTRLLALGESEEILFTAPAEPGDYPYLCTFPGHWRLQQGILRVER